MRRWQLAAFAAAPSVAVIILIVVLSSGGKHQSSEPKGFKVALVSDARRFSDNGPNHEQLVGFTYAARHMRSIAAAAAVESLSARQYMQNFDTMASKRYSVIIGASALLAKPERIIATQYPHAKFAITDVDVTAAPFHGKVSNVEGITFATQESSYLAGCLAGLMTQRAGGRQVIGVVAGSAQSSSAPIAGYSAGAKHCNERVNVLIDRSAVANATECRAVASRQIRAGSQVEFDTSGRCGSGVFSTASEAGIWAIGTDDQGRLPPSKRMLAVVLKRLDRGVYLAIKGAQAGEFTGGKNLSLDLKNGGVALGSINASVPKTFVKRIAQLKAQIVAGKLKPPTGG